MKKILTVMAMSAALAFSTAAQADPEALANPGGHIPSAGSSLETQAVGESAEGSLSVVSVQEVGGPAGKPVIVETALVKTDTVEGMAQSVQAETQTLGVAVETMVRNMSQATVKFRGDKLVGMQVATQRIADRMMDAVKLAAEKDPVALEALKAAMEAQAARDAAQDQSVAAVRHTALMNGSYISGPVGHETVTIPRLSNEGKGVLSNEAGGFRYVVVPGPSGTPQDDLTVLASERLVDGQIILYVGSFLKGQGDEEQVLNRFFGTWTVKGAKWWLTQAFNSNQSDMLWLVEGTSEPVGFSGNDTVNVPFKSRLNAR